jgi:putative phosphonate metabolism protein
VTNIAEGTARYALYWAPPEDSLLAQLGARWLGRDAARDAAHIRPALAGFDNAALQALTADPRRYGLHATLKPPFRLAEGKNYEAFAADVAAFAAAAKPLVMPSIKVMQIGDFIALSGEMTEALSAFANACVTHFDSYRATPSEAEHARRNAVALTERQSDYLKRWGYPYVMEDFRFHITLTGKLDAPTAERLLPLLHALFAEVTAKPLILSELAIFVEPDAGQDFRLVQRFALGRSES